MIHRDLLSVLTNAPAECDSWPVYLSVDGVTINCRAVVFVPKCAGDPLSPRIELRTGLVYRPRAGHLAETGEPAWEEPPAAAGEGGGG